MSLEITMRHIRALAGKRGYRVVLDDHSLHVIKKSDKHIRQTFDLHDSFTIDSPCTQQFTFTRVYYWILGYDLIYKDQAKVLLRQAAHHPAFDPTKLHEAFFDYQSPLLLQCETARWIHYTETHRCPYFMMSLREEGEATHVSEHILS